MVCLDNDGDGLTADIDCDDTNANMPLLDMDCDAVSTSFDCDDSDAEVAHSN